MDTEGPSASVPGIVINVKPQPLRMQSESKYQKYKEENKRTIKLLNSNMKLPQQKKDPWRSQGVKVEERRDDATVYGRVSRGNHAVMHYGRLLGPT
jgi:hypothetical protein